MGKVTGLRLRREGVVNLEVPIPYFFYVTEGGFKREEKADAA